MQLFNFSKLIRINTVILIIIQYCIIYASFGEALKHDVLLIRF
jgi:hypothetical protein